MEITSRLLLYFEIALFVSYYLEAVSKLLQQDLFKVRGCM